MRTTVTIADDVAAAINKLRKERDIGVSEAINELARKGLAKNPKREKFTQRSRRLGLRIDVTNVAEALENLDGPTSH